MAGSVNKVIIVGNVGKDPEIRAMQSGDEIANLTVATSESWKDKATGERKDKTEWHRVVVFNKNLVNVIKNYVKKGSKIYLEGSLQTRKWTDKDGQEKYSTEIVLQNFNGNLTLLDGKRDNASESNAIIDEVQKQFPGASVLEDEIPFVWLAPLVAVGLTFLSVAQYV